jgi:hypothetical protein
MKAENLLLIAGIGFIAYWLVKKPIKVIDINPPMEIEKEEPKTIVLDLNKTKRNSGLFPDNMAKDYNASKFSTVAPPMVVIKREF